MGSTEITELIYELVRQIPPGRVTSYGAIARCIGTGASARVVGWAMNKAYLLDNVPAHRVVNRNGLLSGRHHFDTPTRMQELLEAEGVRVQDSQVQHFDRVFWDPKFLLD